MRAELTSKLKSQLLLDRPLPPTPAPAPAPAVQPRLVREPNAILFDWFRFYVGFEPHDTPMNVAFCVSGTKNQDYVLKRLEDAQPGALVVDCADPPAMLAIADGCLLVFKNFEGHRHLPPQLLTVLVGRKAKGLVLAVCPKGRLTIEDQKPFDLYMCLKDESASASSSTSASSASAGSEAGAEAKPHGTKTSA
jgi:hypothetical protein